MMLRITQCAAPLASLFLFAAAFPFVGNAAQAAGGFAGNVVEAGAVPTATESKTPDAGEQPAMPGGVASRKCTPTKTAVHC
jgi:hypothetical protein